MFEQDAKRTYLVIKKGDEYPSSPSTFITHKLLRGFYLLTE